MAKPKMEKRSKDNPWKLKTPPQTSEYEMYVDEKDGKEIIVCTVGKTVLHYDYRCLADLHAKLKHHGDWIELGSKDEKQDKIIPQPTREWLQMVTEQIS